MATPSQPTILLCNPGLAGRRGVLEGLGYRVLLKDELKTAEDRAAVDAIVHMMGPTLDNGFLATLPNLRLVAYITVGYETVDVDWCRARGIAVTHAQGINSEDVADVGFGLLLNAARKLSLGERMVRDGRWAAGERPSPPRSLNGQKVGIVGLGHIGRAMGVRAEAFRMKVSWWGPRPKADAPWPYVASLLDLAKASDVLCVCAPATPENERMISRDVIEALGPHGLLVNVARGSLVDEDELIAALKDGRLGGAGLDVFEQEPTPPERWAGLDNVALTPHFAGGTQDAIGGLMAQAFENLRLHFAGLPLLSPVKEQIEAHH